MKRSLIILVPFLLLVLLNACDINMGALPSYSDDQWTAIAQTQQVMARPENERIKAWLNAVPTNYDKFRDLEQSMIGKYDVMSVVFPTDYYLEVDMNCECAEGSACCDPERMFFETLQRLDIFKSQIIAEVPATVQYLDVVCFDHKRPFYAMYAPWETVKGFINGVITPADLKASITRRQMQQ